MSDKRWQLLLGLLAGMAVGATTATAGLPAAAAWTAGITTLCGLWWITEALPIPATSLIPFALFPLTGVLSNVEVAQAYGHPIVLLLMGGFMLSKAVERSGAHRRMALGMVRLFGGLGRRGLILGFMCATAISSMWISNTATVLILLPVAQAVLAREGNVDLKVPLMLGIAYSASIGGMGTPIGTPPNLQLIGVLRDSTGEEITFVDWMSWGVPVVLVLVPLAWLLLTRRVDRGPMEPLPALGPLRSPERRVFVVFGLTAAAWILRKEPGGGWSQFLEFGGAGDETVALAAVVAMFLLPDGEGRPMLDWPTAADIPWGLLILFGGGLAIASAFRSSGLSTSLGEALSTIADLHPMAVVAIIALMVTFLTEFTSNTATCALLMPILAGTGIAAGVDPKLLMVPAAISASSAFMMPVATAPNAIVFGTGEVRIGRMAREGVFLNFIGATVISTVCYLLLA